LNVVIHGNGKDMAAGYGFVVLGEGRGYQILKNGKVIASRPLEGIGRQFSLHHPWFSIAAIAAGKHLSFYFDRRLVLECDDDEPLTKGKAGVWTRNNKISLARATVSFSDELSEPAK